MMTIVMERGEEGEGKIVTTQETGRKWEGEGKKWMRIRIGEGMKE